MYFGISEVNFFWDLIWRQPLIALFPEKFYFINPEKKNYLREEIKVCEVYSFSKDG